MSRRAGVATALSPALAILAPAAPAGASEERPTLAELESEIEDRLVAQSGKKVLATPPKRGFNLLAWVVPPVASVATAAAVAVLEVRWSRRRGERAAESRGEEPSPELQRRIDAEPARYDA